ncbi:MAG: sodium:solute symporter family protein [Bacteroidetes bacterium]|nr:sodium:solute symporter family protein [Bacteroidota bacterium]MBU2585645.1 sodium:solute symporter family protein [Bacteroidota bacterium]
MIQLETVDIILIGLYVIVLLLVGIYSSKLSKKSEADYFLADRSLSLKLFVMTTVATWYGGILGIGEFTYRYGVNSWIMQGLPYYVFAIIFAFFFAKKIRRSNLLTIPQKLEETFGRKVSIAAAVCIFIIVTPAPYVLMVGVILTLIIEIPLWLSVIIAMFIASVYLYKAGYRSDVYTDVVQFVLMFLGFVVLLIFSVLKLGTFEYLQSNLEPELLKPFSGIPFEFFLVWFLIGLWTFADPGFHQRSYAAKNEKVAVYGLLISVGLWFVFDFLTTSTGLYARAYVSDLSNPLFSFPLFADKILPSFFKGLFFVALLATVVSTLNSFTFLSAQTLGKDILQKTDWGKNKGSIQLTQLSMLLTSVVSIVLAVLIPSVVDLWYTIGSIIMPGILFPVISSYYSGISLSNKRTLYQMIVVILSTALYFVITKLEILTEFIIEPMIFGILFGILFQTIGLLKIKGVKSQQQ